jgi:hypothetical protein
MLPDFERADRIGEFWSYPESRTFAELLIDCEEDRTLRAVLVGMLREANSRRAGVGRSDRPHHGRARPAACRKRFWPLACSCSTMDLRASPREGTVGPVAEPGDFEAFGDWDGPIWSPEGERVAFHDDADMSYDTWLVANADGSGEPQRIKDIEARSWAQG